MSGRISSETAGDISYLIDTDTTTQKTRTTDGATYLALDKGVYSNDLQTSHDYHIGDYTLPEGSKSNKNR